MKYLKTYESFYNKDDMAREISDFLDLSVERGGLDIFRPGIDKGDTSMFVGYVLKGEPDPKAVEALSDYMMEKHGLTVTFVNYKNWKRYRLYLTEKPLKDACLEWLMKNWSGLKIIDNKEFPEWKLLLNEEGDLKSWHGKGAVAAFNTRTKKAHVDYEKIWGFFGQIYGNPKREEKELPEVIRIWLKDVYGLVAEDVINQITGYISDKEWIPGPLGEGEGEDQDYDLGYVGREEESDDISKLVAATAKKEKDYANMAPSEIQELIDAALDERDFERVKMLSQYLGESASVYLKNLKRIKKMKS